MNEYINNGSHLDITNLSNLIDAVKMTEVYNAASEGHANQIVKFAQNQQEFYELASYSVKKKVKADDEWWVVTIVKTMKIAGQTEEY